MQTQQDVHAMYELVTKRVQETQKRVQDYERQFRMGIIHERTFTQAEQTLASQLSQQYTLAWVLEKHESTSQ